MTPAALEGAPVGRVVVAALCHLLPLLWLFGSLVSGEKVLFLRDMLVTYWPDYSFLERALAEGVWPQWNPHSSAGAAFLKAYPLDLLLVSLMGAPGALCFGVVLHFLLGMTGMTMLARARGLSFAGSWLAGSIYGLSGLMLSLGTLLQLLQAAAWAPWVVTVGVRWWREPTWRRAAWLAVLVSLQISTLSAEIALQTALLTLVLAAAGVVLDRRKLAQLSFAALIALLLSAPAVLGAADLIAGTRRGAGFGAAEVLVLSTNRAVLAEALLPGLFGGPLWYGEPVAWARAFFPWGIPYFVSLYLGPGVLALAMLGRNRRLWLLALIGVLASLGENGPFATPLGLATFLRYPVKFLFLSTFALALLAGHGLDRLAADKSRARFLVLLPGGLLLAAALCLRLAPQASCAAVSAAWPQLASEAGRAVCEGSWPEAWFVSGALGAGAALVGLSRLSALAGPLVVLDLLIANGAVNTLVPRDSLSLGPELRALVEKARAQGDYRWYSYGMGLDEGREWVLPNEGRNVVVFYRLMRQSLAQPTQVIDGLDGALAPELTGWEPPGATSSHADAVPARFPGSYAKLRLANVRWVLSFEPLPADTGLATLVAETRVQGTSRPLRLYSLRDPLPRAFWVPRAFSAADLAAAQARVREADFDPLQSVVVEGNPPTPAPAGPAAEARVSYRRLDPHQVVVEADTPPGFIVVIEGHSDGWRVEGDQAAVRLWRADGRYWAVATPGGARSFSFRFQPAWRGWALACAGLGLLGVIAAASVGEPRVARG